MDWLNLTSGAQIALVEGEYRLLGSPGSRETVTLMQPSVGTLSVLFDASFNTGGDLIRFAGPASAFEIVRSGSSVAVTGEGITAVIPVSATGTDLAFLANGGAQFEQFVLRYDPASRSVMLGNQVIGPGDPVAVTGLAGAAGPLGETVTVAGIAELRAALADPDVSTILVAPGRYLVDTSDPAYFWGQAGVFVNRDVTIASASATERAEFAAGFDIAKGIFVTGAGADVTFERISFADTRVNFGFQSGTANYAGIRAEGGDITVIDSAFTNNFNAIKGNGGTLTVIGSSFIDNGSINGAGQEHHIYWEGDAVRIESSLFEDSGYGHAIKTVTYEETRILDSTIIDGSRAAPPIDIGGGGDLVVEGNTITKLTGATNGYVIQYDTVRQDGVAGAIRIEGNTITSTSNPYGFPTTKLLKNLSDTTAIVTDNDINGNFEPNLLFGDASFAGNRIDGVPAPDIGWRANADRLTEDDDELFLPGITGLREGELWVAVDAGAGDDLLVGTPDLDLLIGGPGNDTLSGGDGDDWLFGDEGDDILFAGSATPGTFRYDNLHGGAGNDILTVGPVAPGARAFVTMNGGDGDDVLDARLADLFALIGGEGNDILIGSQIPTDAWTQINAGPGDDVALSGNGYTHYLFGGTGTDTLVYLGALGTDLELAPVGDGSLWITALTEVGRSEVSQYGERAYSFEFIQFANGLYDVAAATFEAGAARVDVAALLALEVPALPGPTGALPPPITSGPDGAPLIRGTDTVPLPLTTNTYEATSYSQGTPANDRVLTGTISNTFLWTGAGDDHITLSGQNLNVDAEAGDDVIVALERSVTMRGGAGADIFAFDLVAFDAFPEARRDMGTIADFEDGIDRIAFVGSPFASFDEIADRMRQDGDDVVVDLGEEHFRILNTTLAMLGASDFLFA
ncbi:MAG: calcium-binding protein [Erythrobacter sp.]|jgi:Ca2+-binding RTX toxin-like protein|nr:calcium-binding protein [Erythrobacter sp.]